MSLHEQPGKTDEWYTPPYVFQALGAEFDLDVAHPGRHVVDWVPATRVLASGSLSFPWYGFVWMNPPFGGRNGLIPWLEKFFRHGNGIALTPDRTSCPWWQEAVQRADATLFVSGKIKFIGADGVPGKSPAQGTTLLAAGSRGVAALENAQRAGLGVLMSRTLDPFEALVA
jgi:hypothetical protein